jgi:hypothetical protein
MSATRSDHPPIVYVEWRDHATAADAWEDREVAIRNGRVRSSTPITSAGLLLADTEDSVTIAVAYSPSTDHIGQALTILRATIVRFETVRAGRGWEKVGT